MIILVTFWTLIFMSGLVFGVVAMDARNRIAKRKDAERKKIEDAEDLVIRMHEEAQDTQMRRIDMPTLQTGIGVSLIFHREKYEHRGEDGKEWYGPWSVVPNIIKRRVSERDVDGPSDERDVYVTDEYKTRSVLVRWDKIMAKEELVIDVPAQSPAATIREVPAWKQEAYAQLESANPIIGGKVSMQVSGDMLNVSTDLDSLALGINGEWFDVTKSAPRSISLNEPPQIRSVSGIPVNPYQQMMYQELKKQRQSLSRPFWTSRQ